VNPRRLVTAASLAAGCLLIALVSPPGTATAADTPSPTPAAEPADAATTTDTATPTNQPPVANPDKATVEAGRSVTLRPLTNDTDPEHDPLTVTYARPLSGRVTFTTSSITFTARASDRGDQTVDYTISDGTSTASSTVTVTVTPPRVVRIYLASPVVALHHYAIHGSVSPAVPSPVDIRVQRLVKGRWASYKSDRVDAQGRYSVPFTTNEPRGYTFRAMATWGDGKRAYSSRLQRTSVARTEAHVSGPLTRRSVPYSYRSGCPVGPHSLRRITIDRFNYSHVVARGSVIVRASAVSDLLKVFRASFAKRFPIRSMRPTDAFYAHGHRTPTQSDIAAMKADNTSAFNCRPVTGNPYRVSQHSYGNAIDINTVRNPYVVGHRVYPSWARTYLNRRNVRTGMITRSGVIATTMRHNGWPWGARWAHPDYQHFSSNGG
jgi:hypothetical protein